MQITWTDYHIITLINFSIMTDEVWRRGAIDHSLKNTLSSRPYILVILWSHQPVHGFRSLPIEVALALSAKLAFSVDVDSVILFLLMKYRMLRVTMEVGYYCDTCLVLVIIKLSPSLLEVRRRDWFGLRILLQYLLRALFLRGWYWLPPLMVLGILCIDF